MLSGAHIGSDTGASDSARYIFALGLLFYQTKILSLHYRLTIRTTNMKVIDRASEWLKQEGYAPQVEEGFLAVKYQGLTYLIPDTGDDETFLKVDLFFPLTEYKDLTADKALQLCNKVTQDVKIAKALLRDDSVVFAAETLVCASDNFGEVLPRLFDILGVAARYFFEESSK